MPSLPAVLTGGLSDTPRITVALSEAELGQIVAALRLAAQMRKHGIWLTEAGEREYTPVWSGELSDTQIVTLAQRLTTR